MTQCQLMFPVFVVYAVQVFPHCAVGEKGNGEGGREGVLGRRRRRGGSAGGGGEGVLGEEGREGVLGESGMR